MPKPHAVLLLVRELDLGGCERDLTKIALGLDRSRFAPHVGCFHPRGLRADELRAAGIPIVRFPLRSFYSLSALAAGLQMGRYIQAHDIRLVHAYDVPTAILAAPFARAFRTPAIIASYLGYRDLFPRPYRHMLRVTDRLIDVAVVNSKAVRRHLIEEEKVPAGLTYLCYNGVDTRVFSPGPARRAAVEDDTLRIGSVCVLRTEKRMDLLLQAFARLRPLRPGMKLLIVGSGPELPRLEALRRSLGLDTDCIFEPATTAVTDWMRAMDIFVMPSCSESFPNALLEAMACGCAVVASRAGGIPELVSQGQDGLLFDVDDVAGLAGNLARLIADAPLRRGLGEQAARTAREKFSLETALQRTEALYASMLP